MNKRKITLLKLQQICGFLNFVCRCVVPGRTFTRHLYAHTANTNLKPHHHIRVTREMCLDLSIWHTFINQPQVFCSPFLDFQHDIDAQELDWYSDVSGKIGFGVVHRTKYMHGLWDCGFLSRCKPSIEYLELYEVVTACLAWLNPYANKRIILFCDNQSVLSMINNTTSSCKQCMVLIRILVLHCMKLNICVFARYVNTKLNRRSDMLSSGLVHDYERL